MTSKVKGRSMWAKGEKETNLILKIAQIGRLLYSPAQIEVCELHEQELFLDKMEKDRWLSKTTFRHQH
jgi:hypothetical protein